MAEAQQLREKQIRGSQFILWVICFWSGATVMAFELVGARLLMPVFGMGIEVWAAVIATSLGALSMGYYVGGKIGDARPSVLTLAVVLFLTCGSLFFARIWGRSVTMLFVNFSLVTGAWYSSTLILALPLLLLGMVPPILARLMIRATERSGTVVGSLMAVGTVGSVLGTALTGLFLLPQLGVSRTLLLLSVGTAVLGIAGIVSSGQWKIGAMVLLVGVPIVFAGQHLQPQMKAIGPMQVLEDCEGLYGHLEVLEYHGKRALLCNGIFQTVMPASEPGIVKGTLLRSRDYIELLPYFRPQVRTALLIGLGGGLYEQVLALYGVKVRGIEIEPMVIQLAAEYFDLATEAAVGDGRAFLLRCQHQFDIIIVDAFIGGTVPEHLFTKEAFELVKERLNPNGVLAIHLVGHPEHSATRAVAKTVQAVFSHSVAVQSGIANEAQHVFLFASMTDLQLQSKQRLELERYGFTGEEFCQIKTNDVQLLTDDRTALSLLCRDIMAEHRRNSLQIRRKPLW